MAYMDMWNLRFQSTTLLQKTTVAVAKAAIDIISENVNTTNHANRLIWAKEALRDAAGKAEQMMWQIVSNATIAAAGDDATDNDVQFVVNSCIDGFATGS